VEKGALEAAGMLLCALLVLGQGFPGMPPFDPFPLIVCFWILPLFIAIAVAINIYNRRKMAKDGTRQIRGIQKDEQGRIVVNCPGCNREIHVALQHTRLKIECMKCGHQFIPMTVPIEGP
jgi:hypothetical protein